MLGWASCFGIVNKNLALGKFKGWATLLHCTIKKIAFEGELIPLAFNGKIAPTQKKQKKKTRAGQENQMCSVASWA